MMLYPCPMKSDMLICSATPKVVAECHCTECDYYRFLSEAEESELNNPYDAFLSRRGYREDRHFPKEAVV